MKHDDLINSRAVRDRLNCKSRATFDRLRTDPRENFPPAVVIRSRLFWSAAEIDAWVAARPRVITLPARRRKPARAGAVFQVAA